MTYIKKQRERESPTQRLFALITTLFLFATLFICSVFFSEKLSGYVLEGAALAIQRVVPIIFPTLILSDLILHLSAGVRLTSLSRPLSGICGVKEGCLGVLLLGLVCGFPAGAKSALDSYKNGIIEKSECERLMSISNNASAPFVIGVVGCLLFKSRMLGVMLYLSMVLGALTTARLTASNVKSLNDYSICNRINYSFIASVRHAAEISVNVIAFISTFYIISRITVLVVGDGMISALILSFTEISAASSYISDLCNFSDLLKILFISFSVGFSGLSAIMQAVVLAPTNEKFSLYRILFFKLIQGLITSLYSLILFPIFTF